MATRNDRVSVVHVNALNQIDMEFYGDNKDDNKITKSWKSYLEHLGKYPKNGEQSEKTQWEDTGNDKFVDLLMKIGKKLNYEFDIEYLKNDFYTPKAHGDFILEQFRFRKALLNILEGNKSIGVHTAISDENKQRQEKLMELLTNVLNGEQEILIKNK